MAKHLANVAPKAVAIAPALPRRSSPDRPQPWVRLILQTNSAAKYFSFYLSE
jgi:hypothetical protein